MLIQNYFLSKHLLINPYAVLKLRCVNRFRSKRCLFFLDLDGTLWPDRGPGAFFRQFDFFPEWKLFFKKRDSHRSVVLITNQTYFARKNQISLWECILFYIKTLLLMHQTGALLIYICNHHPNAQNTHLRQECKYRKPYPSMIIDSLRLLNHKSRFTYLIGDRISDMLAANLGGVETPILIYNVKMFEENVSGRFSNNDFAFFEIMKLSEVDKKTN